MRVWAVDITVLAAPSLSWATRWALSEPAMSLFDEQGMKINEHVIWIAAISKEGGVRVFKLGRTDIKITQAFLEVARWDEENGKALMQNLLDRRGAEIEITGSSQVGYVKSTVWRRFFEPSSRPQRSGDQDHCGSGS